MKKLKKLRKMWYRLWSLCYRGIRFNDLLQFPRRLFWALSSPLRRWAWETLFQIPNTYGGVQKLILYRIAGQFLDCLKGQAFFVPLIFTLRILVRTVNFMIELRGFFGPRPEEDANARLFIEAIATSHKNSSGRKPEPSCNQLSSPNLAYRSTTSFRAWLSLSVPSYNAQSAYRRSVLPESYPNSACLCRTNPHQTLYASH